MKLSIITINYNNAKGLDNTIQSVVSHHNGEFEYIVIDGNSTDGSVDIIKKYTDKINYWISEPDSGIYNAMNKGIRAAKGEYLLFLNSGDVINKNADFQDIISNLSGEDIVYFDLEIKDVESGNSSIKMYPDNLDFKYFLEDTLPHTASFIKKQGLIDYGYYNENMRIVSDWAFFTDIVIKGSCTYKHIKKSFSTFFNDGISSRPENGLLLLQERNAHIKLAYPLYYSLYEQWYEKRKDLYLLYYSRSIRMLKKIGCLKWFKI